MVFFSSSITRSYVNGKRVRVENVDNRLMFVFSTTELFGVRKEMQIQIKFEKLHWQNNNNCEESRNNT